MTERKLLIHGYVVTMNAEFECIEDGAVLIAGKRIEAVGKTGDLLARIGEEAVERIDCSGKMILPGLIDAHTHAGHCLNRSLGLDSRTRWMDYLTKIYHHSTTPDYWYAEGRLAALERLKAGITCGVSVISNAARCDDPRIVVEHVRGHAEVGTRENPAVGPSNPPYPRAFAQEENGRLVEKRFSFDELMAKAEEAIELVNGSHEGLIGAFAAPFVMVSSVEGSKATPADLACRLSDQDRRMMKAVREMARRQHVRIHTEAFGGMIRLAAQADDPLLGPDVHVQHCKGISFGEAMILAETRTNVTTTPAWHQLQMRCPVPELIELGANVAVTIDAAHAIGREADLGSLEAGKLADIATIKMTSPHLMPRLMPIHQLMLYGNAGDVADVFVAGRALMRERKVLTVSEADVFECAQSASLEAIRRAGYERLLAPCDNFWTGAQSLLSAPREP